MKPFIPIFSVAILMVACKNNSETAIPSNTASTVQTAPAYNPDTVGLAKFQEWKMANELADVKEYNKPVAKYTAEAPVTKRSKVYTAPKPVKANTTPLPERNSGSATTGSNESGEMNSETSNTAKAPVKKGISKAAKGTAIGAGAGAVAGAVIGKNNRVVGGVIGGVVGGAVGYGIGRHMDKKDGRY
jgi:hypothetical protein